ncbi:MAG: hypothetical protein UU43_C0001G0092 [Candidatus Falkowbacteria bacterium GW2011_GWA2_41_14]|uniref:Uncharacterized protein n=1 Tax=Candidatus Falkowbacteria bacterium GW2011_GWA2_41_14 TaxID=1618635 RepID=A0A0G0XVE9_9BACT|nr:MAG: hypothetical protein UU43_C0001G0092 [Candidatus Falkowbacteria bacterium GW2011_GWA2_41_14]
MCPHQESNLGLGLRSPLFYPLNYEDVRRVGRVSTELRGQKNIYRHFSRG